MTNTARIFLLSVLLTPHWATLTVGQELQEESKQPEDKATAQECACLCYWFMNMGGVYHWYSYGCTTANVYMIATTYNGSPGSCTSCAANCANTPGCMQVTYSAIRPSDSDADTVDADQIVQENPIADLRVKASYPYEDVYIGDRGYRQAKMANTLDIGNAFKNAISSKTFRGTVTDDASKTYYIELRQVVVDPQEQSIEGKVIDAKPVELLVGYEISAETLSEEEFEDFKFDSEFEKNFPKIDTSAKKGHYYRKIVHLGREYSVVLYGGNSE